MDGVFPSFAGFWSFSDSLSVGPRFWCFPLTFQMRCFPISIIRNAVFIIRGEGGGLEMDNFWIAIYMMIAIMVIFLMPTSIYVYESDEDKSLVILKHWNSHDFCEALENMLCHIPWSLHFDCRRLDFVHFLEFFEIRPNSNHFSLKIDWIYGDFHKSSHKQ